MDLGLLAHLVPRPNLLVHPDLAHLLTCPLAHCLVPVLPIISSLPIRPVLALPCVDVVACVSLVHAFGSLLVDLSLSRLSTS